MADRDTLDAYQPSTEEGKKAFEEAQKYLDSIKTPEQAMTELKAVGLFTDDGKKNPYFYPDPAK